MPPPRKMPSGPASGSRARPMPYVALAFALAVLLAAGGVFLGGTTADAELDADLCPLDADAIAGSAVLLLDLTKPLGANARVPADVLRDVALGMGADTELRVFALGRNALAPRLPLGRLCKPYANTDLQAETVVDTSAIRDCDDLPVGIARGVRERAELFCERRAQLQGRITGLAARDRDPVVANAYVIEAIEDTRLELAVAVRMHALYIFSDMMQHAEWYSHLNRPPDAWDHADLLRARQEGRGILSEQPPPDPDLAVTIFYVPKQGLTEHPTIARAHQRFWRDYFRDVGTLAFEDQAMVIAYDVERDEAEAVGDAESERPEHREPPDGPGSSPTE